MYKHACTLLCIYIVYQVNVVWKSTFNLTFIHAGSLHGRCLCNVTGELHNHRVPSTVLISHRAHAGEVRQHSLAPYHGEAAAGQLGMTFACLDANIDKVIMATFY